MFWIKPSLAAALAFGFLISLAPAARADTAFEVSGGFPVFGGTRISSPGYYDTVVFYDDYGYPYRLEIAEGPLANCLLQASLTLRFPIYQTGGISIGLLSIDRIAPSRMFDFSMVICNYIGVYVAIPLIGSLNLVASGGLTCYGLIGVVDMLDEGIYYYGDYYGWGTLIKAVGTSGLYPSWSLGIRQNLAKGYYLDWTYFHAPGGKITGYFYLLGHSYLDGAGTEAPIYLEGESLILLSLGKAF